MPDLPDNFVDRRAVGEAEAAAKTICQQFFGNTAGDAVGVALEQCLELPNVLERLARRQHSRAIDWQAILVRGRPLFFSLDIEDQPVAYRNAVTLARAADGVEGLQRKTGR